MPALCTHISALIVTHVINESHVQVTRTVQSYPIMYTNLGTYDSQHHGLAVDFNQFHQNHNKRPDGLTNSAKSTKLSTYYVRSGAKKRPSVECHHMAVWANNSNSEDAEASVDAMLSVGGGARTVAKAW